MHISELEKKTKPLWQKPLTTREITKQIQIFASQNICYGKDRIVGFPGTNPQAIAVKVYNQFLGNHSNNIGLHTRNSEAEIGFSGTQQAEREVIAMIADLMNSSLDEVDGYIASGGTEANLVGCWIGRNSLPEKTAIICSFLTHYSIIKAADILGIGTQIRKDGTGSHLLGTDQNGHLLLDQFKSKLTTIIKSQVKNIIIVGNAGTTMLGSVDNIPEMNLIIESLKKKHGNTQIHFHIDAAFGGFIAPFLTKLPQIDFRNPEVDSITIDAHKMGLAPYGSGIILARKHMFERIKSEAPYVPGNDCTFLGSRPGVMALSCWAVMKKMGKDGYQRNAEKLFKIAVYAKEKLAEIKIPTFVNDINILAVKGNLKSFLKNGQYITHIYEKFPINMTDPFISKTQPVWNIVVMNHTKKALIDELAFELQHSK